MYNSEKGQRLAISIPLGSLSGDPEAVLCKQLKKWAKKKNKR